MSDKHCFLLNPMLDAIRKLSGPGRIFGYLHDPNTLFATFG